MRIAQVSPLHESVPPKLYGGTERVVSYLTEELVRQGHDVTLFASGDSQTAAELVPVCPTALRLSDCVDPLVHHFILLEEVWRRAEDFDVIHFHIDYLAFPLLRRHGSAHITTLHGRLDIPDLQALYREYGEMPLVSISNSQRQPLAWANWRATVYHGLPLELHQPSTKQEGYLAFLGRVSPEKRLDWAIEVARRAGKELRVAAKIDRVDQAYFDLEIRPLLDLPHVNYIGEIDERQKQDFLGGAAAVLFPVDWPEPFGLVQIEAMACGTPVMALRRGSVPEIIDEGLTGFICDDLEEMVDAVRWVEVFDRAQCRRVFEQRFSAERMAEDYLKVYEGLIDEYGSRRRDHPASGPALHPGDLAAS
jgi:glycosyltransferase involved in cell wall biosynthesis